MGRACRATPSLEEKTVEKQKGGGANEGRCARAHDGGGGVPPAYLELDTQSIHPA